MTSSRMFFRAAVLVVSVAHLLNADPFVGFDTNGDGVFKIRDYDTAGWIVDVNGKGLRDPPIPLGGTRHLSAL